MLLASIMLFFIQPTFADEESLQRTLTIPSGEEFTFDVFSNDVFSNAAQQPNLRILWIAPGFGVDPRQKDTAQALAKRGAEVWLIDLADALFLTRGAVAMREIPGTVVAGLIEALSQQGDHDTDILVVSSRYGAIPALRGIYHWQSQSSKKAKLIGAVFFSPSFFTHVPELGTEPSFIPELAATNSPLYIYQAANNSNRWHLPAVIKALEHATVYAEVLPDVMSVFYKRDTSPSSLAAFEKAPNMILRAAKQLRQHPMPDTPLPIAGTEAPADSGINTRLKKYKGKVQPSAIRLHDIDGNLFDLQQFKGKLTLINFWASWCRPCIEEIPSLNRLKTAMNGKAFQLISINYAETAKDIRDFLQEVDVDFPVLLDPGGQLTGQWKVVAFPSTFVIGPDGKIHYGVNAGIHWDTPEVIQQLNQLLPQQ